MARPKTLRLTDIRLDGDTQARCQLDEATVGDYAEAIKRGDKLPPVTVYFDGSNHWLAGGFHRVAGTRAAGRKEIAAFVEAGSRADAAWAALGDNRINGLRLSQADKSRAIKRALQMKPNSSNAAIAKHIGCSDHTVSRCRLEMESTSQIARLNERTGADGKTRPANVNPAPYEPPPNLDEDQPPTTDDEPPAVDEPTPGPAGKTRDAEKPAGPPSKPPEKPVDHAGNLITREEIAEAFRRDEELVHACSALSRVKMQILDLCERNDPLVADIVPAPFEADMNNARRHINEARPFAVCPYCGGDGCKACRKRGWVNETTWNMAPQEMRDALQAGGKRK